MISSDIVVVGYVGFGILSAISVLDGAIFIVFIVTILVIKFVDSKSISIY